MNCKKSKILLQRLFDKELKEKDLPNLTKHLSVCGNCSNELKELEKLHGILNALPAYTPNPFLWTRIATELESINNPSWGITIPQVLRTWVPIACFLILLSSMGFFGILNAETQLGNSLTESPTPLARAILEIPDNPQNLEKIAINTLVYKEDLFFKLPNMEVNYVKF